jgi:hypothetical protein
MAFTYHFNRLVSSALNFTQFNTFTVHTTKHLTVCDIEMQDINEIIIDLVIIVAITNRDYVEFNSLSLCSLCCASECNLYNRLIDSFTICRVENRAFFMQPYLSD